MLTHKTTPKKTTPKKTALALAALAALGLTAARPAAAQNTLGGKYNGKANNGYDTTAGQFYTVLPTASFDYNGESGLAVSGSDVAVLGGDFSHNGFAGVFTSSGSNVDITGGTFRSNFSGVEAFSSTVNITGGDFTKNSNLSLISYGSDITLYGDFSFYGLVPDAPTFRPGSFTGRLENDSASQTFTYGELDAGTITLARVPAAVPESSSVVSFGLLLALGLGGLAVAARRRKAAPSV